MKRIYPHLAVFCLLFLLATSLKAQLSALARVLSMESRAAISLTRAEMVSSGIRSTGIPSTGIWNTSPVPKYLIRDPVYSRLNMLDMERELGGSFMSNASISTIEAHYMKSFNQIASHGKTSWNTREINSTELEPLLKEKLELMSEAYRLKSGKDELSKSDSMIILQAIYQNYSNAIWGKGLKMLSSGGSGGGKFPPTFLYDANPPDPASGKTKKEKPDENENNENENNENENNENEIDSIQYDSSTRAFTGGSGNEISKIKKINQDQSGNQIWWILALGLHLILSSAGLWLIFLKAKLPKSVAFVPLYRIGQLFQVCGYEQSDALQMLIPVLNIVCWIKLNIRICKVFQYPRYMAVTGVLFPGLLWYLIGSSNKYYIGYRD